MIRGKGIIEGKEGAVYKNTLATFIHTHALSMNVTWINALVEMSKKYRKDNG